MINKTLLILILFVSATLQQNAHANGPISDDSTVKYIDESYTGYKLIDTSILKVYREDPQYFYTRVEMEPNSLIERILRKMRLYISSIMNKKSTPYVMLIGFGLIFLFLFYKLFDKRVQPIFLSNRKLKQIIEANDINLSESDYDKLMEEAVNTGNFNIAVRILYLKLLKFLSTTKAIIWREDKTNSEYSLEIRDVDLRLNFRNLATTYEYVWYGHFEINKEAFLKIKQKYEECINKQNE